MEDDATSDPCRHASRYSVFGVIECDVRVPEELRARFAKMEHVLKNVDLTRDDLGPFTRLYAEDHTFMTCLQRKLVGSFHCVKILHGTPLLRWYLGHGLEVTSIRNRTSVDLETLRPRPNVRETTTGQSHHR